MRVSGAQSPQCRLHGTVVSVIIIFVLYFFVFVLVFVNDNHTGSDGMSHGALILNQSIINRSFSSCVTFIRANKSGDDVGRSAACRLPEIRSRATDRRWRRLAVTRLTTCRNNSAAVVDYETSMTLGSHGSRTLGRDRSRSARWELYKFPTSRRPIFTAVVCLICCAVTMSRWVDSPYIHTTHRWLNRFPRFSYYCHSYPYLYFTRIKYPVAKKTKHNK